MGYNLQAFICNYKDGSLLTNHFEHAVKISLEQNISLIPMTEGLYDQINNFKSSPAIDQFMYMTEYVEQKILSVIGDQKFAYVEAEYTGGSGGQTTIVWNKGKREKLVRFGKNGINQVLTAFGVMAKMGWDEFETLKLDRHRRTEDWLGDTD